ncbi:MAG: hypothetical protein EOO81_13395, partial [Oxalobacteraceae bacterium]
MPLYEASDLMRLEDIGPAPGMPSWANLRAVPNPSCTVDPAELMGPGIYALFLDGALFYLGIYAVPKQSVMARWHKHVVAHTLRASQMFMSRSALVQSLSLPGPVGAGLRACLSDAMLVQFDDFRVEHEPPSLKSRYAMRKLNFVDEDGPCAPMVVRSFNTIFNKARFAEANWDLLGPKNDQKILSHITCGYERLQVGSGLAKSFIKANWLEPRETDLIRRMRPICNSHVPVGKERNNVGWLEVQQAILEAFA